MTQLHNLHVNCLWASVVARALFLCSLACQLARAAVLQHPVPLGNPAGCRHVKDTSVAHACMNE